MAALKEISERSGVHVIAISGFYVEDCLPDFVEEASIEELVEVIVQEVTEGADGTNIRTGLLKSGVGRPVIEGLEAKCARAVARAQLRTGLAITTHTSASSRFEVPGGNLGMQHLDLFEEEGVDPSRVIIGHTDENVDIRNLVAMAQRGAYLQFDVIGKLHWMLDETRVELLCQLVERVMATGCCCPRTAAVRWNSKPWAGRAMTTSCAISCPGCARRALTMRLSTSSWWRILLGCCHSNRK